MRLPRLRFTVRRMMVAVVILAVPLGAIAELRRRHEHYRWLASYHAGKAGITNMNPSSPRPTFGTLREIWRYDLSRKYMEAAARPWLAVAPDPPDPGPPDSE
jgi:hypothetical protein